MTKTISKLKQLEDLEGEIHSGVMGVGAALQQIVEKELYLETHESVDKYAKDRWGWTKSQIYHLIANAKTLERVSKILDTNTAKKLKNSHLTEIRKAPEEKQAELVADVISKCEENNETATAKHFSKAVKASIPQEKRSAAKTKTHQTESGDESEPDGEAPVVSASLVHDDLDRPVPEGLREAHSAVLAFEIQAKQLLGVLREVRKIEKMPGGKYLNLSEFDSQIKAARKQLQDAGYLTDCPTCKGKGKCKGCDGLRWIPRWRKGSLSDAEKGWLGI